MTAAKPHAGSSTDQLDARRGWFVTAAAALSMFTVYGVVYSFAAFFEPITEDFNTGKGATAVVFSITICLSFLLGPYTGALSDRIGPRPVARLGALSLAAGLLLTTVVPNIWLAYLCYGLGVGFANACGYVPMLACVSGWFERRRTLALGLAVAGIGLGTMVGSPIAAGLLAVTTWRTAFVIFAIVGAVLLGVVSLVVAPGPAAQAAPRRIPLRELFQLADFRILYLSMLATAFGLFVPFVFISSYAQAQGNSEFASALLVGLIGGSSIVGRLAIGGIAPKLGSELLYRSSSLVMAAALVLWLLGGSSYGVLVVFAIVFGVAYGGFIALSPAIAASRFGMQGQGGILGSWYTSAGIGALLGPFIAGALIDNIGYRSAIGFAAITMVMSWVGLRRLATARPASRMAEIT